MGIFSSGNIFGIRIYNFNNDDISNTLFEEKYDTIMTHAQKREAYLFYNQLDDKTGIKFQIYTECSSTYGDENYMSWFPISVNAFLSFNV